MSDFDQKYMDRQALLSNPPPASPIVTPEEEAAVEPEKEKSWGDAAVETVKTIGDIPDALIRGGARGVGEMAYSAGLLNEDQVGAFRQFMDATTGIAEKEGVNPTLGTVTETFGQMAPAALPAFKGLQAIGMGRTAAALIAEGFAGATSFNPDEPNLANLAQELAEPAPGGQWETALNLLATNPEDPDVVNRARNAIQDVGIGLAFEGLLRSPAAIREMVDRWKSGKSPIPIGMSIEDVSGDRRMLRTRTHADLAAHLPPEMRVAGGQVNPGRTTMPDGRSFLDVDMDAQGKGINFSQDDLDDMWEDALEETGPVAREILEELRAQGKDMNPKEIGFWDEAVKLSGRARYWYEISADAFREILPDLNDTEIMRFIDLVAATSAQADPHQNIRRALGAMSQDLRGVPIDVDITDDTSVRKALGEDTLDGLKTGSFSKTFQHHLGLDPEPALSTNDRQVASSFNVTGEDIAGNDVLYEVLSRFYMNMRDKLNEGVPAGELPFETWQLQALGWVQERMSKGNQSNDDYLMAMERVVDDLKAAGINVPDNKLTRQVLMDPRAESVLSTTVDDFRGRTTATIETVTTQDPIGARAAALIGRAKEAGDHVAIREFNTIVKRSISNLIGRKAELGKNSIADVALESIIGKQPKLSRMVQGFGTFEGDISQNARVPIPQHVTPEQRQVFLAMIGKALKQDAMAASLFRFADDADAVPEGMVKTYSVFIRDLSGNSPEELATALRSRLGDHELNVKTTANGYIVDINPAFGETDMVGIDLGNLEDALGDVADAYGIADTNINLSARHFSSDYIEANSYNGTLQRFRTKLVSEHADKIWKVFRERPKRGDYGTRDEWQSAVKQDERDALKRAKAFLRGKGSTPGTLSDAQAERVGRVRDRYQRRVDRHAQANQASDELSQNLLNDLNQWNTKYGSRYEQGGTK